MSKPKTGNSRAAASLRRLTIDDPGVVTLNIRASQVLVFWASHDTLVPVDAGWYLHAASVSGDVPAVDGELHLDGPFDLNDPKVRWEHVKITRVARTELFLDTGRRYVFFVTPDQSSRAELIRQHQPWPFQLRSPKAAGEPAILAFQAWPLEIDFHRDRVLHSVPKDKHKNNVDGLLAFDSWEHDSIADMPTSSGLRVQSMIDLWALDGLIKGGAMIDTGGPVIGWQMWCPREDAGAMPTNPYDRDLHNPRTTLVLNAKWHYVLPERQEDGSPWTPDKLRSAMKAGNAAALTIGQVIMLAGDLFEKPENMLFDGDRWKTTAERVRESMNIMKVYWEARWWLERQRAAAQSGGYPWQDYRQSYGVVYLVFELLVSLDEKLKSPDTIDEMHSVAQVEYAESMQGSPNVRKDMKEAFDHLAAKAKKVDAIVDLLVLARGPSRRSEMHFLAQTFSSAAHGSGTTLGWIQAMMPWIDDANPEYRSWTDDVQSYLLGAGFTKEEVDHFHNDGIDEMLVQIVVTNGRFAVLAEQNTPHFSDGGMNAQAFEEQHKKALEFIAKYAAKPDRSHPIPSRSLLYTAFGCHFLTDAFSASHMRVPRTHKELGFLSAKLMHDVDGLVGLWVHADDPPQIWYAFGDNYLHSKTLSDKQRKLLLQHVDPKMNFEFVAAAVGSALKQLHYQAHALWQTEPKDPGSSPLSAAIRDILDFNGATDDKGSYLRGDDFTKANQLRNDALSPGRAGPSRKQLWDHLKMTVAERLRFMRGLIPHPLPPGDKAPKVIPDSIDEEVNIPPLFAVDPRTGTVKMNSGDGNPYDIVIGGTSGGFKKHYMRGFTHYKGFSLRVYWAGFKDFWDDDDELRLDFDKYYFMTKFFKDVQGIDKFVDKTLLDAYDNIPKEKW